MEASHTLLCVVHVVNGIVLTLPSSHSKEKEPSWKHPHTLLCVVHVVHRIVITSPSSYSRAKDPSWKHAHILDRVLQVPRFQPHQPPQKKTHPAWRNPNVWLGPLMPHISPFPFSDSSCIWTTSSDSPGSFSASSSVSATSSSLKEGSSWLDQ